MIELWQIIALLALLLGVGAAVALLFNSRRTAQLIETQRQMLEMVQKDLRALCNAAVQVGGRVNSLEQSVNHLQQRQQELGLRQDKLVHPEPEARSFEQAIKLAQKGASVEELMDICDLSRGEAELMSMMHRLG
jgi:HAMP domain-containing protein